MIGIIVRSLMEEIIDKDSGVAFMREEWFGIVAVAIVLAYLILKKDISELKIVSLFLFFGVIGFVCLLIAHYFLEEDRGRQHKEDKWEYYTPNYDNPLDIVAVLSTYLVAFSFQTVIFPVMNSLREGNRRGVIKVSLGGQGVASAIYLPCCYIAIYTFGTKTASDIMTNVTNAGQTETLILSIIFLLIASMHIPIILFVGKEAMLILFYTLTKTPKEEMVEIQGGDITAGET